MNMTRKTTAALSLARVSCNLTLLIGAVVFLMVCIFGTNVDMMKTLIVLSLIGCVSCILTYLEDEQKKRPYTHSL
jgi:hypothetical protein